MIECTVSARACVRGAGGYIDSLAMVVVGKEVSYELWRCDASGVCFPPPSLCAWASTPFSMMLTLKASRLRRSGKKMALYLMMRRPDVNTNAK